MKKLIAAVLLATTTLMAASQTIDTSGLTEQQIQEIAAKAAELKAKNPEGAVAAAQDVSKAIRTEAGAWGELGVNMGKAMVGAAKEVGVAANEFAATDFGKIVTFMVVYKYIGEEVLSIIFGSGVMIIGTILSIWLARSLVWYSVKYEYRPVLWGLYNKKVPIEIETSEDATIAKVAGSAFLLIMAFVVGLNIIF